LAATAHIEGRLSLGYCRKVATLIDCTIWSNRGPLALCRRRRWVGNRNGSNAEPV